MKENHPLVENCGNVPRGTRVIAAVSSLVRVRIENLSMLFFTPPCAPESNADRRRPEASEPSRIDLIPGTNVLPGDPEGGTNTCSSKKALFTLDFRRIDRRS